MREVRATRRRGYSITRETYSAGLNAMAAAVLRQGQPIGAITIAGPSVRFTVKRMEALGQELLAIADQMAAASGASVFFQTAVRAGPVAGGGAHAKAVR